MPGAELVDLRREQLLACAGLAQQQDRRVGRCHLLDLLQHPPQGRTPPDDARQPRPLARLPPQVHVLDLQLILQAQRFGRGRARRRVAPFPRQDLAEHARDRGEPMDDPRRPRPLGPHGMKADCALDAALHPERHDHRRSDPGRQVRGTLGLLGHLADAGEDDGLARADLVDRPRRVVHRLDRVIHLGNPRYRPADDVSQHTIRADLGERAAIESHLLADSAEAVPYRVIDVIGGKIDDLRGQLGDEPFEREQLFERGPCAPCSRRRSLMSTMDARTNRPFGVRTGFKLDLNRKLRTVLAPGDELTTGAMGPDPGAWTKPRGHRLDRAQRLRQQQFDDLPDQLLSGIAELPLQPAIDEHDPPLGVHDQDATRRRLDRELGAPLPCRCRYRTDDSGLLHFPLTPVSLTSSDA